MDYKEEEMMMGLQEIEIVKEMITRNDYMDAREKLVKVQRHFPTLVNNISEMIAVCDILYTADFSSKLLDYGTDWYQVLQVYPTARETEIHHQYRRMTALLQPIKNTFPATASALKITQDAFYVLSDPGKRAEFDLNRAECFGASCESVIFQKSCCCDDLGQREDNSAICKRGADCETLDGNGIDDDHMLQVEQIWAVNDGPDSMPRRYVVVDKLISGNEARVTLLDPHPMLDDEIYWVEENLPFVAGLFSASTTSLNLMISHFSHLIHCEPSENKFFYKIYPRKGEVWAMYRNWNSRWKQSDFSHCRCQIVEIISDLMEDSELKTATLLPLPGCMTFFQRHLSNGFELIHTVPRTEMLSFSHRILAFTVPGIEKHGIPEASLHLEPDALPPNFGMQF